MNITAGFQRFLKDLLNLKLVVIKIIYFFLLAGIVILWPQFTIHQEAIGLTKYQTGIIGSVMSGITIIIPLLGGIIGDKVGNYKVILSIATVLAGVSSLLFPAVPSAKEMTFWVYMAVRVCFGTLQMFSFTLYEGVVMAYTQEYNIDFGFQRAWGTLAVFISSLLGGYVTQASGSFSTIFYLSAGFHVFTGVLMLFLNVEFKLPTPSLKRQIFRHLRNIEVLMFLGAMLAAGVFIGYLETFMYRFLSDLSASPLLISLTVTVGAPFELLLTLVAASVVDRLGHAHVIMLGLLAYAVRLLGFSFLTNPWWSLALEILESITNGLMFSAGIMYCTALFSLETITTFRGIFGLSYFGIGKLLGTIVGTEIREMIGDIKTFRLLSAVAFAASVLYYVGFTILKRLRNKNFKPTQPNPSDKLDRGVDNTAMERSAMD
ncbi:uncharacterized protein LOC122263552 isoform X2 [Penaeus japonicus]|nr:uncharacterized protein LOC122263552 isoform X2 [Penaeus japonicus]XP_042887954.1 uncharacterized protein LOC122263552 isoform X2 [Penaeus japonicus]